MIPISKDIQNRSKSVQLIELHAFCVYGGLGFYSFSHLLFATYFIG